MIQKDYILNGKTYILNHYDPEDDYFKKISPEFESSAVTLVHSLLPEDGIAIDCGANIGAISVILSDHLKTGHVYSFEPGKNLYATLKHTIAENGINNISLFNAAVSNNEGMVSFQENSGYGHILAGRMGGTLTISLDYFARLLSLEKINFIKIDVEGNEWNVLRGATYVKEHYNPVFYLEFNSWCILGFTDDSPKKFLHWLFEQFEYVAMVKHKAVDLLDALSRYNYSQLNEMLYRNLVKEGLVSDILATNNKNIIALIESQRKDQT